MERANSGQVCSIEDRVRPGADGYTTGVEYWQLYSADFRPLHEDDLPPWRDDLVRQLDVLGLMMVAEIFLGATADKIRLLDTGAALVIEPGMLRGAFCSVEELLTVVPLLNQWLSEWASSPKRVPDLQPLWATSRGIESSQVGAIARMVLEHLASTETRRIRMPGGDLVLRVPVRQSLQAPTCVVAKASHPHEIARVEEMELLQSVTGETFLAPIANGTGDALQSERQVRLSDLQRRVLIVPRAIRPFKKKG